MGYKVSRLLDTNDNHVVAGFCANSRVQALKFPTDCRAQPRWRAEYRQRPIEEEGNGVEAIKPVALFETAQQMNQKQPFPHGHHQPKRLTVAPCVIVESLVNA